MIEWERREPAYDYCSPTMNRHRQHCSHCHATERAAADEVERNQSTEINAEPIEPAGTFDQEQNGRDKQEDQPSCYSADQSN